MCDAFDSVFETIFLKGHKEPKHNPCFWSKSNKYLSIEPKTYVPYKKRIIAWPQAKESNAHSHVTCLFQDLGSGMVTKDTELDMSFVDWVKKINK